MEQVRDEPGLRGWRHGPVGLGLQGDRLYVFSTSADDPLRFNAEFSERGVRMLVGGRRSLLLAILALTLEDPPGTLAEVAAATGALLTAPPVVDPDRTSEDTGASASGEPL